MQIDSKGEITLARYKSRIVKTDHRMLKLEIDLEFHDNKKHDRSVVFNVRNQECQKLFCEFTSKGVSALKMNLWTYSLKDGRDSLTKL